MSCLATQATQWLPHSHRSSISDSSPLSDGSLLRWKATIFWLFWYSRTKIIMQEHIDHNTVHHHHHSHLMLATSTGNSVTDISSLDDLGGKHPELMSFLKVPTYLQYSWLSLLPPFHCHCTSFDLERTLWWHVRWAEIKWNEVKEERKPRKVKKWVRLGHQICLTLFLSGCMNENWEVGLKAILSDFTNKLLD